MVPDPFSPPHLLALLPKILPNELKDIQSPQVALAALIHAVHTSLNFRLHPPHAAAQEAGSNADEKLITVNRLPNSWGQADRNLSFEYKHEESSLTFEVNVSKLGPRAIVNAIAVEDNKTRNMDIVITDYFSSSSFPFTISDSSNFESMFASPARLKDLILLYKSSVVQQIAPGLSKGGVEVAASTENEQQDDRRRRGYYPDPGGPILPSPARPRRPQDDYQPQRDGPLADIGRSDLLPLGGMGGTTGIGGTFGDRDLEGDGMFMGPNHPLFRDRMQGSGARPNIAGPWGGDGFLPSGAVPPGARFDPIGPMGGMPQRPNRGFGGIPGPRTGLRGGDPDNDDFPPPRSSDYDNMFG